MDADAVRNVISNMRSPMDVKHRIHFTSRGILFLVKLFEGKRLDVIDLYCILLRLAYASTGMRNDKRFINLRDIIVYLCSHMPECIAIDDIRHTADMFNIEHDSSYGEVYDMKMILTNI